tara:strand:- start:560 stop:787 length:228 start_codon:yes stop_codon:yes gene_type:complete
MQNAFKNEDREGTIVANDRLILGRRNANHTAVVVKGLTDNLQCILYEDLIFMRPQEFESFWIIGIVLENGTQSIC